MKHDEEGQCLIEEKQPAGVGRVSKRTGGWWLTRVYFVALHAIIGLLFTIILFSDRRHSSTNTCRYSTVDQTWSPVQQHVTYELQHEYVHEHAMSIYSGPPSKELDRAWDDLERPSFFRVSEEELERANAPFDNITELADGGYVATLGVYHELHCVRQLRFWLYKSDYYPNLTNSQEDFLYYHLDHCLEALRHVVMCNGNTALRSFAWVDPDKHLPTAQSNAQASCVNWDSIYKWSEDRMVPYNPDLKRPSWVI